MSETEDVKFDYIYIAASWHQYGNVRQCHHRSLMGGIIWHVYSIERKLTTTCSDGGGDSACVTNFAKPLW